MRGGYVRALTLSLVPALALALGACIEQPKKEEPKPAKTFTGTWESATVERSSIFETGENFYRTLSVEESGTVRLESSTPFNSKHSTPSPELNVYNYGQLRKLSDKNAQVTLSNDIIEQSRKSGMSEADIRRSMENPPSITLINEDMIIFRAQPGSTGEVFKRLTDDVAKTKKEEFVRLLQDRAYFHSQFIGRWNNRRLDLASRIQVTRDTNGREIDRIATPASEIPESEIIDINGQRTERHNAKSIRFLDAEEVLINEALVMKYLVAYHPPAKALVITVLQKLANGGQWMVLSGTVEDDNQSINFTGPELRSVERGRETRQQRTDRYY